MGDSENEEEVVKQNEPNKAEKTAKKGSRIQGIKTEFARIIWPDKDTIIKETTAVVVVTAILGAVIALLDFVIKAGLDKILQIG